MVGVWIEPVTAQLMMILFAIVFLPVGLYRLFRTFLARPAHYPSRTAAVAALYTLGLARLAVCPGLLDRRPDRIRRRRHRNVAHACAAQRIEDGAGDGGGRGGRAALAASLDAERIGRREHLGDADIERRHHIGMRHAV